MEYIIKGRKPEAFFRYFEEISAIPRGSYNEKAIADYLVEFANARGLEYYRDDMHNVLIKMPATKGREGSGPILFQGHTDMVCEKNNDVEHDFLRDPLKLVLDGDFLCAEGTTLGADDGMAVAMMLTLLDGAIEEHPAYECLFTAAEEPGLIGAMAFDYSRISARTMINIDCGNQKVILCSCAGGMCSDLMLPISDEPFSGNALRVRVGGLVGGHSGSLIHCGRANANKVMGRLLAALMPIGDVRLVSVKGGLKENAITRECEALLSVPDVQAASELLNTCAAEIAQELVKEDSDFFVAVETDKPVATMMSRVDTERVCSVLACVPNGVLAMSHEIAGFVEYSRNLGTVNTANGEVKFGFYARSARESQLDASAQEIDALACVIGATVNHHSRYPGWTYVPNSPIREAYSRAYREELGEEIRSVGVHAGLECGIVCSAIPDMDVISIGPNTQYLHSPKERLDLSSCESFWKVLKRLIEDF